MFIVGTIKGETNINLAKHLKNCEGGFEIPEEQKDKFIINYGRLLRTEDTHLNNILINNKLEQLKKLRIAGIKVPSWKMIQGRQLTDFARADFPVLARKIKHSKGTDAIYLKTKGSMLKRKKRVLKRDYLLEYIPKVQEFRIHVVGNGLAGISKKEKNEEVQVHHPHVWSRDRGWIQVDYEGEYYEALKEIGVNSIKALNYNFGAVDVILGENGLFYVLEVNSAPRLNQRRRRLYAKYFRTEEKKWREERRNN